MMKMGFLCVLLVAFSFSIAFCEDVEAPNYVVNLDKPPTERWSHVVSNYATLYPILMKELYKIIPKPIVDFATKITAVLDDYIPAPYGDEIRGIAKYTNSSVGETVMGNLAYDFTAFRHHLLKSRRGACTSILAVTANNTLLHGRNLDYAFKNILRNFTINVEFYKGGQLVFKATTFAGMVGVYTGMRPSGISISLDERNTGMIWENIIAALETKLHGLIGVLIRDVLTDKTISYEDAIQKLSKTHIIAPCYLIVGGLGKEGAVITREQTHSLNIWYFNGSSTWYLVETNYDHWNPPPSNDNRRQPAIQALERIGQKDITVESMYQVLSTYPILNNATAYTTVMITGSSSYYRGVIRYPGYM